MATKKSSSSSETAATQTRGRGRPAKLTPELTDAVALRIRAGNYFTTACELCGLARSTAYLWLEIARDKKKLANRKPEEREHLLDFLDAITRANAVAEARLVKALYDAIPTDPKLATFVLERRFPERWGKVETHIKAAKEMSDDELDAAIARLEGREARAPGGFADSDSEDDG